MGYTTEFKGHFTFNKRLDNATAQLINDLANTRRMKRDTNKLKELNYLDDYGTDGEFFVQEGDTTDHPLYKTIVDFNKPPRTQPSLYLQWIVSEDKTKLFWGGGEKFYRYVEWLEYLLESILLPKGYILTETVRFRGEDFDDTGTIIIKDNTVIVEYD